ncbi:MAG: Gfo/Idh/MocA family oxidoreductase [Ruminococcaceae bacterium]|nr:Gfo/Idh/MocA family oxidoreductase [Oscillospiraceae bacterium]
MNIVKFGLLGVRNIARSHLMGINQTNEAQAVAVCDIHEEIAKKTAEDFNIPDWYTDYDEMLKRDDIDVIIVCTPDGVHKDGVVKALRAGKHVMCEKPMALDLEDCKEMIKVQKETGKILMVAQVCRYAPGFVQAKSAVDAGEIGDLFFVESEYAHDYANNPGQDGWRADPAKLRHPMIGGGCHAVDLLRWIAGNPTEAVAYSNRKVLTDWPVDDCTVALLKFPNDVNGKVFTSIGCKRLYTMRTVLYGTKGTIITDNTSPTISIYKNEFRGEDKYMGRAQQTVEIKVPVSISSHNMAAEVKEMCAAVLGKGSIKTDGISGASTVAVCSAIVKAAETGEKVKISYDFD